MEVLTIAAVIAGVIAGIITAILVIRKISMFYIQRFHFSIWSGVLLLVVAFALVVISVSGGIEQRAVYIMTGVSAVLVILTIYNDIRFAGFIYGCVAVLLQIFLSFSFVFLVFFALIGIIVKRLFRIQNSLVSSLLDSIGIKGGLQMLLAFLLP